MEFEGATLNQYDEVIKRMGFRPQGPGAPGGLFHWVAATDTGIRVTDVWETREQYEEFAAEQIGPITQAVGIPGPPTVTVHEVHNSLTEGSLGEQLVRRFFEDLANRRQGDVAEELIAADFVAHENQSPPIDGPDGIRDHLAIYQESVDGHWNVEEIVCSGDRVIARWTGTGTHQAELMGVAATHRPIRVDAISIFRIADGKIAEMWTVWDALALTQQIGAVPVAA